MPLKQTWPSPVTYPKYNYDYKFVPVDIEIGGDDPNDPSSTPTSFLELFKDLTINPEITGSDEEGYSVKGEGILDILMETAQLHLDAQWKSNRIKQEQYAEEHLQMYLGTLQMFNASFIQWKIEIERLKVQVALENKRMELELQIARERNEASERQNTDNIDSQEKLAANQIVSNEKMNTAELANRVTINSANITSSEKLAANQITSTEKMAANEITSKEKMNTQQITSQESMQTKDITSKEKLAANQIVSQEKLAANQIVSNEKISTAQNTSAEKQNTDRIQAQAALVAMQVKSEEQKMHLYRRQIEGFDEDFKQKILKIQLDSWAVGASIAKDSFIGASYTPAAIGKASIDSLYTSLITPEFDNNKYYRAVSTLGHNGMP